MRTSHVHLFSKDRANSKRDYKKFLDFFKRLAEVFPQSPLVGRAKNMDRDKEIKQRN